MFNDRVKTINLGKLPAGSKDGYWVPDVNDAKLQEIADTFKLKLNTVTPGSEWYLYKFDEHKTTGIYVTFVENIFTMYLFCEGVPSNTGDKDSGNKNYKARQVYVAADNSSSKFSRVAQIKYIEGMNGSFILWTAGMYSNNSAIYHDNYTYPIILSSVTSLYDNAKDFCFAGYFGSDSSNNAMYTVLASGKSGRQNTPDFYRMLFSSSADVTFLIPFMAYFENLFYMFDDIFLRVIGRTDNTYYFTLGNQDYVHCKILNDVHFVMAIPSEEK